MELVSLITPCYNSAKFIHRLLDSIFIQTYSNLEIIMVDDGSSDNTIEVIESYREKFEQKGYTLTVLKQENSGQSVAVNNALKLITGKYLLWPDSDDYYASECSIEILVKEMEAAGDDIGMVRAYCEIVEEKTLKHIGYYKYSTTEIRIDNLFEECLYARNFWYCPITSLIKVNDIDNLIKNREIYTEKRAGQNWQIMLPILYNYKAITIPEYLGYITIRQESHSRGHFLGYEQNLLRYNTYEKTVVETLKVMDFKTKELKEYYLKQIELHYMVIRLKLSYLYSQKSDFKKIYNSFVTLADPKINASQIRKVEFLKYIFFIPFKRQIRECLSVMKRIIKS